MTESLLDNAVSYYRHLRTQGLKPSEAVRHVEQRYGIPHKVVLARVNGLVADPQRVREALSKIKEDWQHYLDLPETEMLREIYEAITGETLP